MRALIPILLTTALAAGGCDRQSAPAQQAKENAGAAKPGSDHGVVDRSHKGQPAPDFAFADGAGTKRTIADFAGKPVLLNLWATWCAPCVREMPTLDALATARDGALHVLTVSQDLKGAEVVAPFFAKAGYRKLQPYLDTDLAWSMGLGVNLPTTILFDSSGKEMWRVAGDMDWTGPAALALLADAQ